MAAIVAQKWTAALHIIEDLEAARQEPCCATQLWAARAFNQAEEGRASTALSGGAKPLMPRSGDQNIDITYDGLYRRYAGRRKAEL